MEPSTKRIRRLWRGALAVLSLLVCLLCAVQGIRSAWFDDSIYIAPETDLGQGGWTSTLGTCQGLAYVTFWRDHSDDPGNSSPSHLTMQLRSRFEPEVAPAIIDELIDVQRVLGFGYYHRPTDGWTHQEEWIAVVPFWFICGCLGIWPAWRGWRWWRRSRSPSERTPVLAT